MYLKLLTCLVIFSMIMNSGWCLSNIDDGHKSIMDNISWECANNASCVNSVAKNLISSYQKGATVNFGLFSLEKLSGGPAVTDSKFEGSGRAASSILDFLQSNAIRIPVGPMVFSVGRSTDNNDYLEVALLKKAVVPPIQGRRGERHNRREKKQLQMLIPMYLAATTFGWTLFAIKAVGALTIKAFLVSKLAFLVAAGIIIKKLMDSASEKMMMQQHQAQYIMPYHMDYGMHGHAMAAAEMSPSEFYNLHLSNHQPMGGMENMAAESNLAHAIEIQANATQPQILAALAAAAGGSQKIKRNDQWTGVKSTKSAVYGYVPSNQPVYIYHK